MKVILSALLLGLSACSIINTPIDNRKAIQTALYEGMSKADLLKRLGDPYKIDHLSSKEELVYYETDLLAGTFCLQYTAIRLLDSKVKEWGSQVCKEPSQQADAETNKVDSYLKQ